MAIAENTRCHFLIVGSDGVAQVSNPRRMRWRKRLRVWSRTRAGLPWPAARARTAAGDVTAGLAAGGPAAGDVAPGLVAEPDRRRVLMIRLTSPGSVP
jgi:hypothetical protein